MTYEMDYNKQVMSKQDSSKMVRQGSSSIVSKQGKDLKKTEIKNDPPMKYWQRFKAGNVHWLSNFYSKHNVKKQEIKDVVERHKGHLDRLQGLIEEKMKNKQGGYLCQFAEQRSQSYMPFKVQFNSYAANQMSRMEPKSISSQFASNNPSKAESLFNSKERATIQREFNIDRYNNYMNLTILLSNQRFRYKHIARHYFTEKSQNNSSEGNQNIQKSYFVFQVQKGIPYTSGKDKDVLAVLTPMIIYLMVRDITKAIKELESRSILHADIKPENTICICLDFQDLSDKSKLKDVTFKLIDFDRAYLIPPQQAIEQEGLYSYTKKIFSKIDKDKSLATGFTLVPCPFVKKYADLLQKKNETTGVKGYQLYHATQLQHFVYDLDLKVNSNGSMNGYNWNKNKAAIYQYVETRDYTNLISTLERIIEQQLKME